MFESFTTTTKTLICPGWKTPCCPSFPTGNASPGQKGVPFCPGSGNRDKRGLFVPVVNTNRDKRVCQARGAGSPFCPGWYYQSGQKGAFYPGCQTRDKRAPPFIPAWRSRLGNRDNKGFPTGTNQRFCSSDKKFSNK